MADYRFSVVVDVDIANAESEAEARKAAFALLTTPASPSKGRPSSGPRGMVTGIAIHEKHPAMQMLSGASVSSDILEGKRSCESS